jgi:hypothetical protein
MDEAERCHEIAYIAYGELMARGTTLDVVKDCGLHAFVASGAGADRLAGALRDAPGVSARPSARPCMSVAPSAAPSWRRSRRFEPTPTCSGRRRSPLSRTSSST